MAAVFLVSVAGCGGGGGEDHFADGHTHGPGPNPNADVPTAAGAGTGRDGLGRGPAPIPLFTAGNFAVLAETAITNVPTSAITGNVGLAPAPGVNIELTCAEVTGTIYTVDSAGSPSCRQRNAESLLIQAVADGHAAWNGALSLVPDYTNVRAGNIGGINLPPAVYEWNTGVQIPANLTLTGGPNDVWIFLIELDLIVSPGVQIILAGGALPQNVFWQTVVNGVAIGEASQFQGIILSETTIFMGAGASINGRLLAAGSINLNQNTVTQP